MDKKRALLLSILIMFIGMGSVVASSVDGSLLNTNTSSVNNFVIDSSNLNLPDSSLNLVSGNDESNIDGFNNINSRNNSNAYDLVQAGSVSGSNSNSYSYDISGDIGTNQDSSNLNDTGDVSNTFVIGDESSYNTSNQNLTSIIQDILNSANSNSTIEFLGSSYSNLNLVINKPLNIISNSGTVINSSLNSPIFSINHQGSGTNISGFTLNSQNIAISVINSENVNIKNNELCGKSYSIYAWNTKALDILYNNILNSGNGIYFSGVSNSNIQNNNISSSSSKGIYLVSSKNVNVYYNNVVSCAAGLFVDDASSYLDIQFNNFTACGFNAENGIENYAVTLNSGDHVTYANNILSGDRNSNSHYKGLNINGFMSSSFVFTYNVIQYVNDGINLGEYFGSDSGSIDLGKTAFIGCASHCIEAKESSYSNVLVLGNLYYDTTLSSKKEVNCPKVTTKNQVFSSVSSTGDGISVSLVNKDGSSVGDFVNFAQDLSINNVWQNMQMINGKGTYNLNAGTYSVELGKDNGITSVSSNGKNPTPNNGNSTNSNNNPNDSTSTDDGEGSSGSGSFNGNSGTGSGTGSGSGTGDGSGSSSSNDGSGSSSLSSSSSSSTAGLSSSGSASAGNSPTTGASSSSASSGATAKSLTVDDEFFRVAGVGGLLVLIILVVCVYYSKDIKAMLKK